MGSQYLMVHRNIQLEHEAKYQRNLKPTDSQVMKTKLSRFQTMKRLEMLRRRKLRSSIKKSRMDRDMESGNLGWTLRWNPSTRSIDPVAEEEGNGEGEGEREREENGEEHKVRRCSKSVTEKAKSTSAANFWQRKHSR